MLTLTSDRFDGEKTFHRTGDKVIAGHWWTDKVGAKSVTFAPSTPNKSVLVNIKFLFKTDVQIKLNKKESSGQMIAKNHADLCDMAADLEPDTRT
jgi:hypothetical protein